MFVIGVTGGIGCGKSTVAALAVQAGLPVLDADAISRAVTVANGVAIPEIREAFGARALTSEGSMNRQWVAEMAFRDKPALDHLSAIIHRHVVAQMAIQMEAHREKDDKALILDVPIPIERGFVDVCDQIWLVWADDQVRIPRLLARGMSEEDIRRRIAMQMTREEYEKRADHIIWNNGTREELAAAVHALFARELTVRGIRYKK